MPCAQPCVRCLVCMFGAQNADALLRTVCEQHQFCCCCGCMHFCCLVVSAVFITAAAAVAVVTASLLGHIIVAVLYWCCTYPAHAMTLCYDIWSSQNCSQQMVRPPLSHFTSLPANGMSSTAWLVFCIQWLLCQS